MARRRYKEKGVTHGAPFRKKSNKGTFKKGTWVRYKYVNNRRVATVRSYRKR